MVDAREVAVQEGVEDELRRDAQQVERLRPVLLQEGAGRRPVLAQHDLFGVARAVCGIAVLAREVLDQAIFAGLRGGEVELRDAIADGGIGAARQPLGRLHHVRVGVVDDATLDVRHRDPPRFPRGGS